MGWMFVLNHIEFQIIDANYDHSKAVWKKKKPHEETFILKIRKDEKNYYFILINNWYMKQKISSVIYQDNLA